MSTKTKRAQYTAGFRQETAHLFKAKQSMIFSTIKAPSLKRPSLDEIKNRWREFKRGFFYPMPLDGYKHDVVPRISVTTQP